MFDGTEHPATSVPASVPEGSAFWLLGTPALIHALVIVKQLLARLLHSWWRIPVLLLKIEAILIDEELAREPPPFLRFNRLQELPADFGLIGNLGQIQILSPTFLSEPLANRSHNRFRDEPVPSILPAVNR